jgi:3-hydroxybutyryl-CoA dehydrogenase
MGHGIAYVSAASGYHTTLTDASPDVLAAARERIASLFGKAVEKGKLTAAEAEKAHAQLSFHDSLEAAIADADLVVEAVPEDLELKRRLATRIEQLLPSDAMIASNTSALSISGIATALSRADRFLGMHFFNPVPAMRLVELVRGALTSDATVEAARVFVASLGKTPIVVKDSPGFATSRLGVVLGLEAMRMLEQGVASAADIDQAMELGYNHPVGPLKLTDIVGLDVRLAIARHLHSVLRDDTYKPPQILIDMVSRGNLGRKSGRGFYEWNDK